MERLVIRVRDMSALLTDFIAMDKMHVKTVIRK